MSQPFDRAAFNISFRIYAALAILAFSFFLLALRLWYLQIVRGEYFRQLSENNRIRTVFVSAPRGRVLDRNGEVLAKNRPAFNIELVTEDCPDVKGTVAHLEQILMLPAGSISTDDRHQRKRRPFEPKLLLRDVSRDTVALVVARKYELPGITVGVQPAREYVYHNLAAHSVGYIREVSKDQLSDPLYQKAMIGDLVGQFALEKRLEHWLQGVRGLQRLEVDAHGNRIGEFSFDAERQGHDVRLTIDRDVQAAAEEVLKDQRGAVVALQPYSGEVLALASTPGFDPNIFTGDVPDDIWRDLSAGKEKKLTNRAVQGAYPPGSTFKMIMGVAALAEGVITPQTSVYCPGHLFFGGRSFSCHKKSGHGNVNLYDAIVQSCDVFFYEVGQRLGVDRINDYATRFGLGELTGLDLVQENKGIVPSTEWKRTHFRREEDKKWYPGETLSVAIGQGATTATPLQMARAMAALVNGGNVMRPFIYSKITSQSGRVIEEIKPEVVRKLDVDASILKRIRDAMVGVVRDQRGTGHRAKLNDLPHIIVGGKTGTAQAIGKIIESAGGQFGDHAWFIAFAPSEKPEIALAVLVENGGHGGVVAAPVSRAVMEAYFKKRYPFAGTVANNSKVEAKQQG